MRIKIKSLLISLFLSIMIFPLAAFGADNVLKLGLPDQHVPDVTVTENMKEAFKSGHSVDFTLPQGVNFTSLPIVQVVEGDLQIDSVSNDYKDDGREYIRVKIKSESTKPSTIKISDIRLTINRAVPNGPVMLDLSGDALNEAKAFFEGASDVISKINLGEIIGLPTDSSVVFKIGNSVYFDNGISRVMDATPYVKNGRTYVPVRFLATALGVPSEDINFANDKVTIIKGTSKIELVVGSDQLVSDGKAIKMDVSPEYQDGRVMLPARAIAEVLGARVGFDNDQVVITSP